MIARIRGKLIEKAPDSAVVEAGGVGYEVFIPLSTYYALGEPGVEVTLTVHTHLKDDAIELYGFLTGPEKDVFRLLISVSGVGPRLARNIISGIPVEELATALATSDRARISKIPGVGAKTAERLILELKEKITRVLKTEPAPAAKEAPEPMTDDVVSALENLGYKAQAAKKAATKAAKTLGTEADFERLFRETLKELSGK